MIRVNVICEGQTSSYNKPNDGNFIAMEIGLAVMRRECKHFNDWLTKLEGLAG